MQVTEIHIFPITPRPGGLVAFANIVMDDQLNLSGLGIYQRRDGSGYRLTYPMKGPKKYGGYAFHPISRPLSCHIETAVLAKVKTVMDKSNVGYRGTNGSS